MSWISVDPKRRASLGLEGRGCVSAQGPAGKDDGGAAQGRTGKTRPRAASAAPTSCGATRWRSCSAASRSSPLGVGRILLIGRSTCTLTKLNRRRLRRRAPVSRSLPKVSGYVVAVLGNGTTSTSRPARALFQIDRRDYQIALNRRRRRSRRRRPAIKNVDAQTEAQKAKIEVAKAQVPEPGGVEFAKADAARTRISRAAAPAPIQESQSATSTLQQRQAALQSSNASVVAGQKSRSAPSGPSGPRPRRACHAKAQVEQAELNLGYTTVTAAQAGPRRRSSSGGVGQLAQAGAEPGDVRARRHLGDRELQGNADRRHAPGPAGRLEIDAYPGRKIPGRWPPSSRAPAPPSACSPPRMPPATM